MNERWREFRVWIKSRPGPYAQVEGKVDVCARSEREAEDMAYRELQKKSFPDRNRSMWTTVRVEKIGHKEGEA